MSRTAHMQTVSTDLYSSLDAVPRQPGVCHGRLDAGPRRQVGTRYGGKSYEQEHMVTDWHSCTRGVRRHGDVAANAGQRRQKENIEDRR